MGRLTRVRRTSKSAEPKRGEGGEKKRERKRGRTFDDENTVLSTDLEDLQLSLTRCRATGGVRSNRDGANGSQRQAKAERKEKSKEDQNLCGSSS